MISIIEGSIDDLCQYKGIYAKYIHKAYSNLSFTKQEIKKIIEKIDNTNMLQSGLCSPLCRIIFIKDDEKIIGFLEAFIKKNDYMFEKDHIYISNLFIEPNSIQSESYFKILYQMFQKIINWAKDEKIVFICNDVDENNDVMKKINKIIEFIPYRTRYFYKING